MMNGEGVGVSQGSVAFLCYKIDEKLFKPFLLIHVISLQFLNECFIFSQ